MPSQDFIELMNKLHNEKYQMLSKKVEYDGMSENPSLKVTVILEKDGNQVSMQSSEPDFFKHVVELRGVADTTGEHKFIRIKDLKQYNTDAVHLIDEDRSKIKKAVEEIKSGKFTCKYRPAKLIDEFLENKKNVRDVKFLPLRRDYYYILAAALIESNKMLKMQEMLIKKYPEAQKIFDAIEGIFLKSFRPTNNALKNYRFYKKYINFDIDELGERMSTQLTVADDTSKDFIRRGKVDSHIAIPRSMNIYGRFLEILAPIINLIRIGLELKRGNPSPEMRYEIGENIKILKSDSDYGSLFGCLDEQIRHSDAHASIRIEKTARKVFLIDARSGKGKVMRVYTFDELVNMINVMENEFFPVIYPILVLFDIAMFELLLVSREYKHLLLAIDNC